MINVHHALSDSEESALLIKQYNNGILRLILAYRYIKAIFDISLLSKKTLLIWTEKNISGILNRLRLRDYIVT